MEINERLLNLRKKTGLSLVEFAEKPGLTKDTISSYEKGRVSPSIPNLIKLANAYDLSVDYLVGNTEVAVGKKGLKRFNEISTMSQDEQDKIYMVVDALIRDFKIRAITS